MILPNLTTPIYVNLCPCGWHFPALSDHVSKCPQCRDVIATCICCGKDISDRHIKSKYCHECSDLTKKIYDRHMMHTRRKYPNTFKRIMSVENICNMDCFNCQFADCIMPVDDETLPLFD